MIACLRKCSKGDLEERERRSSLYSRADYLRLENERPGNGSNWKSRQQISSVSAQRRSFRTDTCAKNR